MASDVHHFLHGEEIMLAQADRKPDMDDDGAWIVGEPVDLATWQ